MPPPDPTSPAVDAAPGEIAHGFAAFGPHSVLHEPVVSLVNPAGVHVGSWVNIGAYAVIEALVPERGITVRIGDGAYLGNFLRLSAATSVDIGAEALISDRVYISDTGHRYEDPSVPIKRQGLRDGRRVTIGAGAWLGVGSVVVGDVTIGENAVIAANTVVRGDVEARTVVAGDPAQVVRRYDGERWWSVPPAFPG